MFGPQGSFSRFLDVIHNYLDSPNLVLKVYTYSIIYKQILEKKNF